MKRFVFLGLGLLGAGLAFGCSSDDGGAAPLSIEELAKRSGESGCARTFDCCTAEERQDLPYESEEACRTSSAALVSLLVDSISESVNAGRIAYDADAAGSCMQQIEGASCAEYSSFQEGGPCDSVIRPLVPVGGACAQNSECINGHCEGADGDAALGVCEAFAVNGAPCETDSDCSSDFCGYAADGDKCAPKQPAGEPCGYDDQCASDYCDDNGTCAVRTTECTL
jgi:hypothetical protein